MRILTTLSLLSTLLLLTAGCLGRPHRGGRCDDDRERHCGDEDGDGIPDEDDDDGPVEGGDDSPDPEGACEGYDPLPETLVATVEGTYYSPEIESGAASGEVTLMLTLGEWEYDVEAYVSVRDDMSGRSLMSCEDGTGTAACFGSISVTLCSGDGYFSYDNSTGSGSWSYYDPDTGASGSGSLYRLE